MFDWGGGGENNKEIVVKSAVGGGGIFFRYVNLLVASIRFARGFSKGVNPGGGGLGWGMYPPMF